MRGTLTKSPEITRLPIDLLLFGRMQESLNHAIAALHVAHTELNTWDRLPTLEESGLLPTDFRDKLAALLEDVRNFGVAFDNFLKEELQKR